MRNIRIIYFRVKVGNEKTLSYSLDDLYKKSNMNIILLFNI